MGGGGGETHMMNIAEKFLHMKLIGNVRRANNMRDASGGVGDVMYKVRQNTSLNSDRYRGRFVNKNSGLVKLKHICTLYIQFV